MYHVHQGSARKQHVGGLVVAYVAARLGTIVCWEWSQQCRAWKWDMMDEWGKTNATLPRRSLVVVGLS